MINKLKNLRTYNSEEGFTLIELMIVVVIIGILAAIAIPVFANQQKEALFAGMKSDVKNTYTNVITALVKDPDASRLIGNSTGVNGNAQVGTTTATIVVSDPKTTVFVGNPAWNDVGKWDSFGVFATNSSIGPWQVFYTKIDSTSGKTQTYYNSGTVPTP